jgi:hypothetical protein
LIIFLLIDKTDEFQLVSFILQFKAPRWNKWRAMTPASELHSLPTGLPVPDSRCSEKLGGSPGRFF